MTNRPETNLVIRLSILAAASFVGSTVCWIDAASAQPEIYEASYHPTTDVSTLRLVDPVSATALDFEPLSVAGEIQALALAPTGFLYALVEATPEVLVRIDLESRGIQRQILDRDLGYAMDLAFDKGGQLWLCADQALYRVDPDTASTTLVRSPVDGLQALGTWRGLLVGLVERVRGASIAEKTHTSFRLAVLDRVTGDITEQIVLSELSDIATGDPWDLGTWPIVEAMALDASGNPWVLMTLVHDFGGVPETEQRYFQVDLSTDQMTEYSTARFFPRAFTFSESARLPGPAEVPTLGTVGRLMLATLLGLVAVFVLRVAPVGPTQ